MRILATLLICTLFINGTAQQSTLSLITPYETGDKNITPTYKETIEFCQLLDVSSKIISFYSMGKSSRGLDIPVLIADKNGYTDPEKIKNSGRLILMIMACIHPGEPDGKDAGFLLFRDIAIGDKNLNEILENVSIVFIPIFNVDGHERFGPYTRINQNGPKEAGWRTTSLNLNLNRDFLKAESVEMQQFLPFYHKWNPDFFIDCHTTNGADYQYVLTYAIETGPQTHASIATWTSKNYLPEITQLMTKDNYLIFPYIGFKTWHDPRTPLMHHPSSAIISNGYIAACNRPGLLIETHMLKPYYLRVESTYAMIKHTLFLMQKHKTSLMQAIQFADSDMTDNKFKEEPFPVSVGLSKDSTIIDFLGVDFTVDTSSLSGGPWFHYDNTHPLTIQKVFFSTPEIKKQVKLPQAYIFPPEYEELANRLTLHGIQFTKLSENKIIPVQMIRFHNVTFDNTSYEGCQRVSFECIRFDTLISFPIGSFVFNINQRGGRILALLLEPESKASFVSWGYFNSIFEQKEYSEMYVMEEIARKMIEENPDLLIEFENERAANPDQYTLPWNVLNWFYMRSPWFDQHLNLYPIGFIL